MVDEDIGICRNTGDSARDVIGETIDLLSEHLQCHLLNTKWIMHKTENKIVKRNHQISVVFICVKTN